MRSQCGVALLAVLLLAAASSGLCASFNWVLQTSNADWAPRMAGGVECWPSRLTYLDKTGRSRTISAGSVSGSGCPLILWGGDDNRLLQSFTDVWVSSHCLHSACLDSAHPATPVSCSKLSSAYLSLTLSHACTADVPL